MNKFLEKIYFDKIRYILDNLKHFDLVSDEIIVVLVIIILQEKSMVVDINNIVKHTQLESKVVDDVITLLASKNYLEIKVDKGEVSFDLSGLFNMEESLNYEVSELFKIFENEFKRMLTQNELVRLNEWLLLYPKDLIIDALRRASIMEKLDFNYINRILENDTNE